MRQTILSFVSILMIITLANCARDNQKKPAHIPQETRFGKGGSASAAGVPPQNQNATEPGGQPPTSDPSVAQTETDSSATDDTIIETPAQDCLMNLPGVDELKAENKDLTLCDSVFVETDEDGNVNLDAIPKVVTKTPDNNFGAIQLDNFASKEEVRLSFRSEKGKVLDPDGKDLLYLTYALPDTYEKLTTEKDIDKLANAIQLIVKINDAELARDEFEIRVDTTNRVHIRIKNLERVANINFTVEIQYTKSSV